MSIKLNYFAGCRRPRTASSSSDSDCQSQIDSGCLAQDYQFQWQLAAGLTGARLPVPAGSWFDWQSQLAASCLTQDWLCLVSAGSRPPRLSVPASRRWTDPRLPFPAGSWFDWCKIFSSGWPPVGWLQLAR